MTDFQFDTIDFGSIYIGYTGNYYTHTNIIDSITSECFQCHLCLCYLDYCLEENYHNVLTS